jgi:hypothetical protein
VVTGVAAPCTGPVLPGALARLPVTVTLSRASRVVATQSVRGRHVYRFAASPGAYVVASKERGGSRPVRVTVQPGATTVVPIRSSCK